MFHQFDSSDVGLLVSLGYTCVDLLLQWDNFSTCSKPIHQWLFTSCACAIGFRLTSLFGSWACSAAPDTLPVAAVAGGNRAIGGPIGELLLDIGHKGWLPKVVETFTWTVFVPFFALWNFLGTSWLWHVLQETPQCIPNMTHVWFSAVWLLLTYVWLIVHIALAVKAKKLKGRVQRAEANFRGVEDAESLERWGQVSSMAANYDLVDSKQHGGLCPAAIKALPSEVAAASGLLDLCQHECSICLTDVSPGECMRRLPRCGHTFHRSCIDLWLVRQADCPLCKRSILHDEC